jgi:diguanylate cyclase (GGDEF)-like protein
MYALWKRIPAWTWLSGGTLLVTAVAVGLTYALGHWWKGEVRAEDLWIGLTIPLLLAPVVLGAFHRLLGEVRRTEERLRVLAEEDPLTGVMNRRRFLEILENEWSRARRYERPLTLLLLDADHFKALNDEHGHLAGDAGLRHIARTCRQSMRSMDVLCRFGGEEFLILLPETPASSGLQVAERIRRALADRPFLHQGFPVPLTVSIGVSANIQQCPDSHTLLLAADQALYRAKNDGRNRVVLGSPEIRTGPPSSPSVTTAANY